VGGLPVRRIVGLVVLALVTAIPLFVALAASPASSVQAHTVNSIPPLPPVARGGTVDLTNALDRLPLVVDDFPDSASRAAVAMWRAASALEPQQALGAFGRMYSAAAGAVPDPAVEAFRSALLAGDPNGKAVPAAAEPALPALARDPLNAGRLTDAAVALFGAGIANARGRSVAAPDDATGGTFGGFYNFGLELGAIDLLRNVVDTFGPSREALLDLAYFTSVTNPELGLRDAVTGAERVVHQDPSDVTARTFLADLQARRPGMTHPERDALATLAPLASDGRVRGALVHALRGDALLQAASQRRLDAVATAHVLARRALHEYDLALAHAADAGLYAGRSRALDVLGEARASDMSMARAVSLAPSSFELRLARAATAERVHDASTARAASRHVLDAALTSWSPRLSEVRFVLGPGIGDVGSAYPGDFGYLGASIGSNRDLLDIVHNPEGEVFLDTIDLVTPVLDPVTDDWRRTGFAPDVAASMAVEASVALHDVAGATSDADRWARGALGSTRLAGDGSEDQYRKPAILGDADAAILMARGSNGIDVTAALSHAETTLLRFGRFKDVATLCAKWRDHLCEGDALALERHFTRAATQYRAAVPIARRQGETTDKPLLRLGWAELRAGNDTAATDAFERAVPASAQYAGPLDEALTLLGDEELRAGNVEAAKPAYELALATLQASKKEVAKDDQIGHARLRGMIVHARTNHAVTVLRLAQPSPEEPPVCAAGPDSACAHAGSDLRVALAIDPSNSAVLVDVGEAQRASGHPERARDALAGATRADPASFPAFNDLGVLAARDGDDAAARRAFSAALAANPQYSLAEWNLGVLDLKAGPLHYVAAQRHFARAVDRDSSLANDAPALKTDERVYRSTFGALQRVDVGWPVGRSFGAGALVLGTAGFVAALTRLLGSLIHGMTGLTDWWERGVGTTASKVASWRPVAWLRRSTSPTSRRIARRVGQWAPWLGVAAVLTVVALITALREPGTTAFASVVGVLLASGSALALHEGAHLAAAYAQRARLVPKQWTTGAVLAVFLTPFRLAVGPFFAEHFEETGERGAAALHAAGPIANLAFAGILGAVYLWRPAPFVLLAATVNLAVAGYSLMPRLPMDGKVLGDEAPALYTLLTLLTGAASAALLFGS